MLLLVIIVTVELILYIDSIMLNVLLCKILFIFKIAYLFELYSSNKSIDVFVDGACRYNGDYQRAVGGIGISYPSKIIPPLSLSLPGSVQTNNRAELYAIFHCLQNWLEYSSINIAYKSISLNIFTDSRYCTNIFQKWIKIWRRNNWNLKTGERIKNIDLILNIEKQFYKLNNRFQLIYTQRDHVGIVEADRLAKNAIVKRLTKN